MTTRVRTLPLVTAIALALAIGIVGTDAARATGPAGPDLTIDKRHTMPFVVGQEARYDIVVTNLGPAPTNGTVVVRDTLPAGLDFLDNEGDEWVVGALGPRVTATYVGVIAPGDSARFTLVVRVSAAAYSLVTNRARVSGGGDVTPGNDIDADTTRVIAPDLSIDKRHTATFAVGQAGVYTLVVTNLGNAATGDIATVRDTLPAGLTFLAASGTGWSVSDAAGVVIAQFAGAIASGDSAAFTLMVSVDAAALPFVVNAATVATAGDVRASNDRDTDLTALAESPDLTIDKRHTAPFGVGQDADYDFVITNFGASATVGATVVRDTLPLGLTFAGVTGAGWVASAAGQRVTATHTGPIAPGDSSVFHLTVHVSAQALPAVINRATVSGGGDTSPGDNTDADPTDVDAATPSLVEWLHAEPAGDGVRLEWRLSVGASLEVTPERAASIEGEWERLSAARGRNGEASFVIDHEAPPGRTSWYRLTGLGGDGHAFASAPTSIDVPADPTSLALDPPSPNPARGPMRCGFTLGERAGVHVSVVDVQGREVALFADGVLSAGRHVVEVDTRGLRTGVYFVRLQSSQGNVRRRFAVIR